MLSVFEQFLSEIVQSLTRRRLILVEIIRDLFDGTVHYANTRKQALINNGTLVLSKELQRYLMALSPTLGVAQWLREQNNVPDRRRYDPFSKAVVGRLRGELHRIADSLDVVNNEANNHSALNFHGVFGNAFRGEPAESVNVQSMCCPKWPMIHDNDSLRFYILYVFSPKARHPLSVRLIVVSLFLCCPSCRNMSCSLRTSLHSEWSIHRGLRRRYSSWYPFPTAMWSVMDTLECTVKAVVFQVIVHSDSLRL